MAEIKSYEEFEKEFNRTEPRMNQVQQSRRDIIIKILNQRVGEVSKYGEQIIKRNLAIMDLHMDEIIIIEKMSEAGMIHERPTNGVYAAYERICLKGGINPMNQIAFSRFMVKYFDYTIKDKKIKGKKYRIFINIGEEWWKI